MGLLPLRRAGDPTRRFNVDSQVVFEPKRSPATGFYVLGGAIFLALMVGGLYYVKWDPYFHKALAAAISHTIGASILTGQAKAPPQASWAAAWQYAVTYFNDIWEAGLLGILAGAAVQTLVPQHVILRLLGKTSWGSTFVAGVASIPSMM